MTLSASPQILKAQPLVDQLKQELSARSAHFLKQAGRSPGLAVILIGDNPASRLYVSKKTETAKQLGIQSQSIFLNESASPHETKRVVEQLNQDPLVDGILIQRPLPKSFDPTECAMWVSPNKDVDGLHPENVGLLSMGTPRFEPCTPSGIIELLKFYKIEVSGKHAVVVGRSMIVGKPMAMLLTNAGATVTTVHRSTMNPKSICALADILIVAAGSPNLIDESWIKSGAVVVDVGIHKNDSTQIMGDVDFPSAMRKVSAISPVPGGVGPMTIHTLMKNTIISAEMRGK